MPRHAGRRRAHERAGRPRRDGERGPPARDGWETGAAGPWETGGRLPARGAGPAPPPAAFPGAARTPSGRAGGRDVCPHKRGTQRSGGRAHNGPRLGTIQPSITGPGSPACPGAQRGAALHSAGTARGCAGPGPRPCENAGPARPAFDAVCGTRPEEARFQTEGPRDRAGQRRGRRGGGGARGGKRPWEPALGGGGNALSRRRAEADPPASLKCVARSPWAAPRCKRSLFYGVHRPHHTFHHGGQTGRRPQ